MRAARSRAAATAGATAGASSGGGGVCAGAGVPNGCNGQATRVRHLARRPDERGAVAPSKAWEVASRPATPRRPDPRPPDHACTPLPSTRWGPAPSGGLRGGFKWRTGPSVCDGYYVSMYTRFWMVSIGISYTKRVLLGNTIHRSGGSRGNPYVLYCTPLWRQPIPRK